MNPDDFRIRTDWYFPYTPKELIAHGYGLVNGPIENKPVATCTNLVFERGPGYIGIKFEKDKSDEVR